jgi:hypothetical protein
MNRGNNHSKRLKKIGALTNMVWDLLVRCSRAVDYNGTEFGMSGFLLKIPKAANVKLQIGEVK